ncbi:MAG: FliA/WhiG family RNA polymerase sigma factor [Thermodesulfobacteriota bacterium]|nr:FliA/WhiG family RNA polymerase sigma factor [Thermodesulfobacteriota bacterium]
MQSVLSRWKENAGKLSQAEREELILEYAPLVKYIAQRIAAKLPPHIDTRDLINIGIIGLMDAIEKFDQKRDIKFQTYAEFRIRGAIFDELRAQDLFPRAQRKKAKILEGAYAKLEKQLERTPSDEEVASELNVSLEEFHKILDSTRSVILISLDELVGSSSSEKIKIKDMVADIDQKDPFSVLEMERLKELLGNAIESLPSKYQLVISLYYYEELTMKEIAKVLGLTVSRVSQIHTKAILSLKGKLKKMISGV